MNAIPEFETVEIDIDDDVALVTLNHPPVNAFGLKARADITLAFDHIGARDDVRAVVLTGKGKTFSAGADLLERADIASNPGGFLHHNRLTRACFEAIMECPKPVIAAVNGAAIGAGCVMALVSDILVVGEEAFIAMTEVDFGLAGGARHMMRCFSPSDARLVMFTAKRIYGSELYRMNVASICVEQDKVVCSALEIGRDIASKAPLAVAAAKRAFDLTEELPLRDGYRYEQSQTTLLAGSEDTAEAVLAFREKRSPVFTGK